MKRFFSYGLAALALALLAGCAAQRNFNSKVTVFSDWPGSAGAGSYTFTRSAEQDKSLEHKTYEAAVREVLASKGFTESSGTSGAQFKVALSYQVSPSGKGEVLVEDPYYGPWGPYWYPRIGLGYRGRHWGGFASFPLYHYAYSYPLYIRELKIEISDAATDAKRYEATARNDSRYSNITQAVPYLARAALDGFPQGNGTTRIVQIPVPEAVPAATTPPSAESKKN